MLFCRVYFSNYRTVASLQVASTTRQDIINKLLTWLCSGHCMGTCLCSPCQPFSACLSVSGNLILVLSLTFCTDRARRLLYTHTETDCQLISIISDSWGRSKLFNVCPEECDMAGYLDDFSKKKKKKGMDKHTVILFLKSQEAKILY